MIRVSVRLDGEGCLSRLDADGHALRQGKEFSPVCAAVTVLLRTAASLFEAEAELKSRISLPDEGRISMEIGEIPAALSGRFRGITDFLVFGLLQISRDAPEELEVRFLE